MRIRIYKLSLILKDLMSLATYIIYSLRRQLIKQGEMIVLAKILSKKQGVMVDVGAHFGESAKPFLKKGWVVYSFEPDIDSDKREKLARLIKIYSPKYIVSNRAVSDTDDKTTSFFVSKESTGISSLVAFANSHKETQTVKTISLRTFLERESVKEVQFLKTDTEGNDLFVLKGFPFEKQKPDVILCEFEDSKTREVGYDYQAIGDFLVDLGYKVFLSEWFPIVKYGVEHRWRCIKRYPCKLEDEKAWGNFIALKDSYAKDFENLLRGTKID